MKPYSLLFAIFLVVGAASEGVAVTPSQTQVTQKLDMQSTHAGLLDDMGDLLVNIGPSLWSGITQMANWLMGGAQMIASFFSDKLSEAIAALMNVEDDVKVASLDNEMQLKNQLASENAETEARLAAYQNNLQSSESAYVSPQPSLGTRTVVLDSGIVVSNDNVVGAQ